MGNDKLKKLTEASLFAAITVIATMIIRIPTVGTGGYINIGDTVVLLSAWILGGWFGAAAAGLGAALADIIGGYAVYAPGTFLIKAGMALTVYALFKAMGRTSSMVFKYTITALVGEVIMVVGYFIYEAVILGYGMAAAASAISNCVQGMVNIILGVLLVLVLKKAKVFKFPAV